MTPLELDFLVSIYTGSFRRNNDALHTCRLSEGTLAAMVSAYLIESEDSGNYRVTERGKVMVEHILATPMPEQSWTVPPHSEGRVFKC